MNKRRKLLVVILGLILLTTFGMPSTGKAQGIIYGDRIDEGQVVDQNVLLNGTEVVIDGTVNGDVLAFGRTITVNGSISGSLLAAGERVTINGQVSGNVMAGAVLMELGPEGQVGRELYFAGARLTLPEGSAVQRDLYMIGLETQLSGDIGRDIHAIIGPLQIVELIFIPLRDRITLISAVQPEGIDQSKAPRMSGLGAGALAPNSFWLAGGQQAAQVDAERLQKWVAELLRNLIALLVLGLIGVWLVPAPLSWAGEKIKQAPWRMALSGLTVYVVGWFIAFLVFLLILGLAFFFYSVTLANMGFLMGTLGLTGLGLGVSVFWFSIAYVSKLVIAFLFGRLLLQRLAPSYAQSNLWPMLLGTVLYALLASIPYLGWVVATVVTFFGLGALWAVSLPVFPRQKEVESIPPALAQTD
jgi:cytoskeletal protein CcmA (bactofilin family)